MSSSLVQPRSMKVGLGEVNWRSKLMARLGSRWRRPSIDRLPEYLLRDAGLERVGGLTRRRLR